MVSNERLFRIINGLKVDRIGESGLHRHVLIKYRARILEYENILFLSDIFFSLFFFFLTRGTIILRTVRSRQIRRRAVLPRVYNFTETAVAILFLRNFHTSWTPSLNYVRNKQRGAVTSVVTVCTRVRCETYSPAA